MTILQNVLVVVLVCYMVDSCHGDQCVKSCKGMPDGDYHSCKGCQYYATCSNANLFDARPCPGPLVWDDNKKRCEWSSSTCNEEVYNSCKDLKTANPSIGDGEYQMDNGLGEQYTAYCEFYGSYGYMFISKNTDVTVQLDMINPSTTSEVLVRHLRSNTQQFDTRMRQISSQVDVSLSIQYNKNDNYAHPQNYVTMGPYLYLGFLPKTIAKHRNTQGYSANENDFTFGNCDSNPNSYLAFFFNGQNENPTDYHNRCCYTKLMRDWIRVGESASIYLPCHYFFQFEMHMGGCGGYAINGYNTLQDIVGAALGMRFEL